MVDIKIIKKNGLRQDFDKDKIIKACQKSAHRAMESIAEVEYETIANLVCIAALEESYNGEIPVEKMHFIVIQVLKNTGHGVTAESYSSYRNYKQELSAIMDEAYTKDLQMRYLGDKSNANTDSTMIATQRSLSYGIYNNELYNKFFLSPEELKTINEGYIYIHDKKDRRDGINCCLLDVGNILKGGFEMGNIWYNEPKTLDVAFDVISDILMSASAQQYGGMTAPEIDTILLPYAHKSYDIYLQEYLDMVEELDYRKSVMEKAKKYALKKVRRDMEQGFQSWEYRFNTVGSSRGDYPFIAISFGLEKDELGKMLNVVCMEVRKGGQGKKGFKKPVLFPKLSFLYDEEIHGEGKELEDVFNAAIDCSSKCMYPDFLSLSGEGYIPEMYKKYGKVVSLMGCRASLSPWFVRGGIEPADDNDEPVFVGRFNIGAVSLHLPMILAKAQQENKDFYEVLDHYLEMIRQLHIRTRDYLGEKKAGTNPLGFTQGGFYGGNLDPDAKISELLAPMTASFGITALNELQQLFNGKSLVEDGAFALEVMEYINKKIDEYKKVDHILYAVYGTPAESLSGRQATQFRDTYGVIKGVSDKDYLSNSFHCHVTEDITPIQKQDLENRFWNLFNGGKIQYCKYPVNYNINAIKTLVRRAMRLGFYEGVNLKLSYCEHCGHEELDLEVCPKCGSKEITKIDRMNGLK